jgi:hypothetical protein
MISRLYKKITKLMRQMFTKVQWIFLGRKGLTLLPSPDAKSPSGSIHDKIENRNKRKPSMTKYHLKQENHTSLKHNNSFLWVTLLGIKLTMRSKNKVFLPNSDTSTRRELYPNSPKMMLSQCKGRSKYACCPVLCNCPIQLLATDNTHTMLSSAVTDGQIQGERGVWQDVLLLWMTFHWCDLVTNNT